MTSPRAASTVLLVRDRAQGGFEVFMVKRHGASGFMAGAHVFPGGKLDEADSADELLAHVQGRDPESARTALDEPELEARMALGLFVAGVRETFEEAGVLLGDVVEQGALREARRRLHDGASFAEVVRSLGSPLRLDWAVPLARWVTPAAEPRRFDTRFFVARAPEAQQASHDARETTDHAWLSPEQAIERMERGELTLPPPTLRNLQWLRDCANADAVLSFAAQRKPPLVAPVIQQVEGKLAVILPGDPLHPEAMPVMEGATRLVLESGRWWSK